MCSILQKDLTLYFEKHHRDAVVERKNTLSLRLPSHCQNQ